MQYITNGKHFKSNSRCLNMRLILLLTGTILIGVGANTVRTSKARDLVLEEHGDGGQWMKVISEQGIETLGHIGRNVGNANGVSFEVDTLYNENLGGWKVSVSWTGPTDVPFEDCISFGTENWYGGPEQKEQHWPIQKGRLQKYSYVSKEEDNAAVSERYWLSSSGKYIYVHPEVPLFVDYHNIMDNHICLIAEVSAPYSNRRTMNVLKYDIWFFDNPREAHLHAVETYLGKPSGTPDYRMIQYPVWSTWAKYSRDIDHENLWEYANRIADSGFSNSQFEIDDLWEICYGSLTVDERKFPDMAQFVRDIKSLGFRVSIWIHPFINRDCEPWYSEASNNGYLVTNEEGGLDTSWWNNNGSVAGYVDFTNPEAAAWWAGRVRALTDNYGIDSFKFDAGESSWSPQIPVQNGDINLHPAHIVQTYVRTCAEFGPMIEVRSGMRTQDLPIFVRMVDKDTFWGFNNGLATLITTLLQMNLNGYTLVLPDMIGGNGYTGEDLVGREPPNKELFIRWLQANTFMPALQYSFVPWDYDDETVEICERYTQLHADYADTIIAAIEASMENGTPVNAPIWWIDPTDEVALATWDEYLLGDRILVAPVVEQGATSRDVYLPQGRWMDEITGEIYTGPVWLENYPAPLDVLPYFILEESK